MTWITDPNAWIALVTLTLLEIVLGIDNIIMLTILVGRLPPEKKQFGRVFGLFLAMLTRILLLLSLVWISRLTTPLLFIFNKAISGRDIILFLGGLFLIAKSTQEIHQTMEGEEETHEVNKKRASFWLIVTQIALIDIVFSLDSVITAVGLVNEIPIMVCAVVLSMLIMMVAAKPIGEYVDAHPTIKMLALSFLILIGFVLIGESMGLDIPKGYIYFAMAYSVAVEMLNLRLRAKKANASK